MPMERAPFGCLTDKPSRYMITPMLNCVTPVQRQGGRTRETRVKSLYSGKFLLPVLVFSITDISVDYYR